MFYLEPDLNIPFATDDPWQVSEGVGGHGLVGRHHDAGLGTQLLLVADPPQRAVDQLVDSWKKDFDVTKNINNSKFLPE